MALESQHRSQRGWHYTLRRSRRARRLRLQYSPDRGLLLVLPSGVSRADAEAFLLAQDAWVSACHGADPQGLDQPRREPVLPMQVDLAATGESLDVSAAADLRSLHELMRLHATQVLPAWVARLSEKTGLPVSRVSVRNQRSRWGSYSSKRTMSLNWRLLLMPPDMVEYVILHELAHSRHLNHSAEFWCELEAICEGARERDRAFDRRAADLLPRWSRTWPA